VIAPALGRAIHGGAKLEKRRNGGTEERRNGLTALKRKRRKLSKERRRTIPEDAQGCLRNGPCQRAVPQLPQNFAPGATAAWHFGHVVAPRAVPQLLQNFAPGATVAWHFGQVEP